MSYTSFIGATKLLIKASKHSAVTLAATCTLSNTLH